MSLKGTADGKTLVGNINKCELLTISAYGIAVKNGFEGTIDEWLASIKGEPGEDGYTPQKGVDYCTDADKKEMVAACLAALSTIHEATVE